MSQTDDTPDAKEIYERDPEWADEQAERDDVVGAAFRALKRAAEEDDDGR